MMDINMWAVNMAHVQVPKVQVPGNQQQEHPLLNTVILEHMLSFMKSTATIEDLKTFRLVSRTWFQASLTLWRAQAKLKLGPPDPAKPHVVQNDNVFNPVKYLAVNKFLELMSAAPNPKDLLQLQTKPYANLELNDISFGEPVPDSLKFFWSLKGPPNLWGFLAASGTQVEGFGFNNCVFANKGNVGVRVFEDLLTQKLFKIKKLMLTNNKSNADIKMLRHHQWNTHLQPGYVPRTPALKRLEISGDVPIYPYLLFMDCCDLKELIINNNYDLRISDYFPVVDHRRTKFPDSPLKLKKLDVLRSRFFSSKTYLRQGFPVYFRYLNLSLEYLSLTLQNCFRDFNSQGHEFSKILQPLLVHCRKSLKILKIFRAPLICVVSGISSNHQQLITQEMVTLEQLYLYGNLVESFEFLRYTPELRVLYIDTRCLGMRSHVQSLYIPSGTREEWNWVQKQYRPFWNELLASEALSTELETHPLEQMTSVTLLCKVSSGMIEAMASWMPNLKVFKAIMEHEGVWKSVCKEMRGLEEVGILRGSQVEEKGITGFGRGQERDPWNITKFYDLKRFEYLSSCGRSHLTDSVVYRGFLQVTTLQEICICVSLRFSQKAERILRENVGRVTIIRNIDNVCRGDYDCCEEDEFQRQLSGWLF